MERSQNIYKGIEILHDVSDTPEEAKYSMRDVMHMDKCGILPEDFKRIKETENGYFDMLDWRSFLAGVEAGAHQCMADLNKPDNKLDDAMRHGFYYLMSMREKTEFRGRHMSNFAEIIVGIISGKTDPKSVK